MKSEFLEDHPSPPVICFSFLLWFPLLPSLSPSFSSHSAAITHLPCFPSSFPSLPRSLPSLWLPYPDLLLLLTQTQMQQVKIIHTHFQPPTAHPATCLELPLTVQRSACRYSTVYITEVRKGVKAFRDGQRLFSSSASSSSQSMTNPPVIVFPLHRLLSSSLLPL